MNSLLAGHNYETFVLFGSVLVCYAAKWLAAMRSSLTLLLYFLIHVKSIYPNNVYYQFLKYI